MNFTFIYILYSNFLKIKYDLNNHFITGDVHIIPINNLDEKKLFDR